MGETVLRRRNALRSPYGIRLIKGSHIVVPRVHAQKQAYILQNEDKRIVFVIPWMDEFSIIGTTDVEYKGDPKNVEIDESEINYLLKSITRTLRNSWHATISSGPTPACVRCAMTSQTLRRPSPATIRSISMM
jgi:glycerol-3-phosphate dehydrogenase